MCAMKNGRVVNTPQRVAETLKESLKLFYVNTPQESLKLFYVNTS